MSVCELLKTIRVGNTLGECILWNAENQLVWWTDIHESTLYNFNPASSELKKYELPERLGSFGFIDNDSRLICAFASGFAIYQPENGEIEWLARPELSYRGTRFNDGRVDREGCFWAGTMVEGDGLNESGNPVKGSLYRLAGRNCTRMLGDIDISNSICWSLDGSTLYFANSPTQIIHAFDMNGDSGLSGSLLNKGIFAKSAYPATPDGSVIDADGYLWNAQWGGGKIVRYSPLGDIDYELQLPVSQPTCICFGGPDMNWLFVTTANENLNAAQLVAQPNAGDVFIYRTRFKGLVEPRFKASATSQK